MGKRIEWKGGECPVAFDTKVRVWFSGGDVEDIVGDELSWEHKFAVVGRNIVEYEVIEEAKDSVNHPDAAGFLRKAAEIMEERGKTYDTEGGERSMAKTVSVFNIKTGHNLTEAEGWLLLQDLKDVRQWSRKEYHQDSAEDCIAYSALKAEALAKGT